MSLERYNLDLAFREPIAPGTQVLLNALKAAIRNVKKLAVKIKEGASTEEATVKAVWHRCNHDEGGKPCEPEQEI